MVLVGRSEAKLDQAASDIHTDSEAGVLTVVADVSQAEDNEGDGAQGSGAMWTARCSLPECRYKLFV